jgi:hypothetical protein
LRLARGDAKAPSRGANGAPSGPEGDKAAARRKKARPSKPAPKREVPAVPPGDGDAKDDAEASGGTSRWTCPGCGEEFPLRDRWYHIANAPPCQEKLEELRRRASDYRPDREAAAGDDQRGPPGQTQDASHPGGIPAAAVEAPARPDPKALAKRFREGFLARGLQHKPPSYQLAGVELMADFAGLELDDDVLAEVLAAILEEVRP